MNAESALRAPPRGEVGAGFQLPHSIRRARNHGGLRGSREQLFEFRGSIIFDQFRAGAPFIDGLVSMTVKYPFLAAVYKVNMDST